MNYDFKMPAPIARPVLTPEEQIEYDRIGREMDADAERDMQEWSDANPGDDPFPEPPADYVPPPIEEDPAYHYERVKDNFRELGRIIEACGIAGCCITRRKVFWFIDAPSNENGHELIMTTRYFWPNFEEGTPIARSEAMRMVAEAMKAPEETRTGETKSAA